MKAASSSSSDSDDDVQKTPLPQPSKKEPEKKDRAVLIKTIKQYLIRNPSLKVDTSDELGQQLYKLSDEELELVIENIELQLTSNMDNGLSLMFFSSIGGSVESILGLSGFKESIEKDKELIKSMNNILGPKLMSLPDIVKVAALFTCHVLEAFKKKYNGTPNSNTDSGSVAERKDNAGHKNS